MAIRALWSECLAPLEATIWSGDTFQPWNFIGAGLTAFWLVLVMLFMIGFTYSYFWSAATIIYLNMRYVVDETVTCVVQVKGKVKARLEVSPAISDDELEKVALADEKVVAALDGAGIRKVIVRAPKLVNIVPA